jgi:hypothetical protein
MYHWQAYGGAGEALLLPLADRRGYLPEPGDDYHAFDYRWLTHGQPDREPFIPDHVWRLYIARCEAARREAEAILARARAWVSQRQTFWATVDATNDDKKIRGTT